MHLNAVVYCDCFEKKCLRSTPIWNVYVDEVGERSTDTSGFKAALSFDAWNATACQHAKGVLIERYLGGPATVASIRTTLSALGTRFQLLLSKDLAEDLPDGEFITPDFLPSLKLEVDDLSHFIPPDPATEACVRDFGAKMSDLIAAAQSVCKPIAFC